MTPNMTAPLAVATAKGRRDGKATAGDGSVAPAELASIAIEVLHPNAYNPNEMTEAEFTELVAEVRHLGRLPKPIIVRPNGAGYLIVDGEHGWRAAKECGLETVPCEVVEVDDFEAMRQTFKRNQHGTHNQVRLGQMFEQMMAARSLSQRALAKEMEVSEGTVRNALEYAKAAGVRNDYAWHALSVRQVRWYNRLPRRIGDVWVDAGADCALLGFDKGDPAHLDDPNCPEGSKWLVDRGIKEFRQLADSGLLEHIAHGFSRYNFADALKTAREYAAWEGRYCHGGLTRKAVRPYTRHFLGKGVLHCWYPKDEFMVRLADGVLKVISDTSTEPPSFLLSPEEFDRAVDESAKLRENADDFKARLELIIAGKGGAQRPRSKTSLENELLAIELREAPDWIRDAVHIDARGRHEIWKSELDEDLKRAAIAGEFGGTWSHFTKGAFYLPSDILRRMHDAAKLRKEVRELIETPFAKIAKEIAEQIGQRLELRKMTRTPEENKACAARLASQDKTDLIVIRDALSGSNQAEMLRILGREGGDGSFWGKFKRTLNPAEPPPEVVELKCGGCSTTNRVPFARLKDGPKCGKCGAALEPNT